MYSLNVNLLIVYELNGLVRNKAALENILCKYMTNVFVAYPWNSYQILPELALVFSIKFNSYIIKGNPKAKLFLNTGEMFWIKWQNSMGW